MKRYLPVLFILALTLAGCSTSIDEEKDKTAKVVEDMVDHKAEAKEKAGDIEFYLPFGAEVEKETSHNVIIKKGSDTFILFNNPQEDKDSDLLYKTSLEDESDVVKKGTFQGKDGLGYYIIKSIPDSEKYELIVGVGGTKVSTQSDEGDLSDHAKMMMKMATSVKSS
ncbi:hypothetical protein [Rossellomorea marisflavi]|uniref:hypothetical protein n=1 Tax=Rossellomorea marisflavi TaxID=189381 RepID=UPI00345A90D5